MGKHKGPHHQVAAKRARFEPDTGRSGLSPTTAVMALCLLLGSVLVYLIASGDRTTTDGAPITSIGGTGGDVTLPVAAFADGIARFYRYTTTAGREVRFFVMRSSDGVIRAAFDACDTCYRDRLGYHQRGDHMVCNKCGRLFRSVDINVLQGGCNPSPLQRAIVGDQVVLSAASIDAGVAYF